MINSTTSAFYDTHKAGGLQDLQMTRGCRPRAGEPFGNFTCCHVAASKTQHKQNLPAGRMGKGSENRVCCLEFFGRGHDPRGMLSGSTWGNSIACLPFRSSTSAPIGSHTDITSGFIWAVFGASESFQAKISTK